MLVYRRINPITRIETTWPKAATGIVFCPDDVPSKMSGVVHCRPSAPARTAELGRADTSVVGLQENKQGKLWINLGMLLWEKLEN
jgi:hypothetical protein